MKKLLFGILVFLSVITLTISASGEFWACFNKGEVVHYCNDYKPDWTCGSSSGCQKCMSVYRESENCYIHGVWYKCNKLIQECGTYGGGELDITPPNITVNSPVEGNFYSGRKVLFDISVNERADIYYYDNINGRGRWTRVCSDCFLYIGSRSFKDGFNNITIIAEDVVNNAAYKEVTFNVDSKKPKIRKTYPRKGFVSSEFIVQYDEENIKEVKLHYGNYLTGFREEELLGCPNGRKQECSVDVDLIDYDSQEIEYYFTIKDVADAEDESKHIFLQVDETNPKILNQDFWSQGGGRYNKYIYFNISIEELNFDEVNYRDNTVSNPRWRRLCTRLKDDMCVRRKNFRKGYHNVDIQIIDEAGNAVGENIEFTVDY